VSQQKSNGSAADLIIPHARWCGSDPDFEKNLEELQAQFVDKLAQKCNAQNAQERDAKRFACAVDECLESITTGTSTDTRRLRIEVYNNAFTGSVGLLISWSSDRNLWNRALPSLGANCIHSRVFAETHFDLRQRLREKTCLFREKNSTIAHTLPVQ
jgi:hypothetical protein